MTTSMRTKIAGIALATTVALGGVLVVAEVAEAHEDREERLQQKVDDGTLTQEEADAIRERMAERHERRAERRADRTARTEALADQLGLTTDELRAELRSGTSLADLAEAAGVDIDDVIGEMVASKAERIEAAVADGRIDQETADARLEELRERVTARVNGEAPEHDGRRGHHRRGHGGPGGHHHHDTDE